uniref:THAP domain-containing protein 1 n=1 Tax=Dicentrarchus labrax TaxID=13489 RepID=A0A8P4G5Z3_DICLA
MGRQCCSPGCRNTSGLHSFPADITMRRQWFRALGLPDRVLPPRAGVCNRHFTRDCFSNFMQVDAGFTEVLQLKRDAVPNTALPTALYSSSC